MEKIHIYFVPGLAASEKIFERLRFPEHQFETHSITWKIPTSKKESLQEYSKRMCAEIKHENPVLLGVSFGGIVVQEMSKIINTKKVILVSSIKSKSEIPKILHLATKTKLYKLFPVKIVENFDNYAKYFVGNYLKRRAKMYKRYLSIRNRKYLRWSIKNLLHWQQTEPLPNTLHIHGTNDPIFPIKYIKNCIEIENGTHEIILTKPKIIVSHIINSLT